MNKFTLLAGTTLTASSALAQIPILNTTWSSGIPHSFLSEGNYSGSSFDTKVFVEENTIKFSRTNSEENQLTLEMIAATQRYSQLITSFHASKLHYPDKSIVVFRDLANELCNIPFNQVVSSFNSNDESIDVVLKMDFDINLSISKFLDDDDELVVFSIHRNKKRLVSNEMALKDIEVRLIELINELKQKYA